MRKLVITGSLLVIVTLIITGSAVLLAAQFEKTTAVDPKGTLESVTPRDGFRYFSGSVKNYHNHPAMYAHGTGENEKIVVVGRGCNEEFPMTQFDAAVKRYRALLIDQEYHP